MTEGVKGHATAGEEETQTKLSPSSVCSQHQTVPSSEEMEKHETSWYDMSMGTIPLNSLLVGL